MNSNDRMRALLQILADACDEGRLLSEPGLELLESGLLDSLAFIELLEGIENVFGVALEPTQVPRERWSNAASILALIDERQSRPEYASPSEAWDE